MLEVGNGGMSVEEYRTHFSLWCMLTAPLIVGNDLRNMSADTLEILTNREVVAVDQDILGKQGTRASEKDGVEIWVKPLRDGGQAVAVFNRNDEEREAAFVWTQVGRTSKPASLRDLWRHSDIVPAEGAYCGPMPGHGVIMLLLK
jgi:alpha-galactosidase